MTRVAKTFQPGPLLDAHIRILKIIVPERPQQRHLQKFYGYEVRFLCCGKIATLTHKRIVRRIAENTRRCQDCARTRDRTFERLTRRVRMPRSSTLDKSWEELGVVLYRAEWPVPPSVRAGANQTR